MVFFISVDYGVKWKYDKVGSDIIEKPYTERSSQGYSTWYSYQEIGDKGEAGHPCL